MLVAILIGAAIVGGLVYADQHTQPAAPAKHEQQAPAKKPVPHKHHRYHR